MTKAQKKKQGESELIRESMHRSMVRSTQENIAKAQSAAEHCANYAKHECSETAHYLRLKEIHNRHAKELEHFLYIEIR